MIASGNASLRKARGSLSSIDRWIWHLLVCSISSAVALTAAGCSRNTEPLNVIVITLDTFRADALGTYGSDAGLTPRIDAFADGSIVFDRAVAPIGTTFPSHASLFTGLYPNEHGVRWNGDHLDDSHETLSEMLGASGFQTAAFVSTGNMLYRGGLHQGFQETSHAPDRPPPRHSRSGKTVNRDVSTWLNTRDERPFFLWVHYFETHTPYQWSDYAEKRQAEIGYDGILSGTVDVAQLRELGTTTPWTPDERAALRAVYDGEVSRVDQLIGDLLDILSHSGVLDESILVLTADHGEALGEHDAKGHGFLLSEPVLRVPLVVRIPKSTAPRRIGGRVGHVDLVPTLLDLLELPQREQTSGQSWAPLIEGGTWTEIPHFAVVRALGNNQFRTIADVDQYAAYVGPYKIIRKGTSAQAFDLHRDPKEQLDVLPTLPEAKRRELMSLVSSIRAADEKVGPIEDSVLDELRALGYIQ